LFLTGALLSASAAAADLPLPRYKLTPGQELRYSGKSTFKYEGGQHGYDTTWRIWVVRQNEDGGWRLLLRSGMTFRATRTLPGSNKPIDTPANERVTFAWCDMSPAGEFRENESLGYTLRPNAILPRLPDSAEAARAGWTSENRTLDERNRYRLLASQSTPERLAIEVVRESNMNEIYGSSNQEVVTFDVQRGLPEKSASQTTQTYGFNGKGDGLTQLEEVLTHDAQWAQTLAAEADRYFAAKRAYEKAAEEKSPDELEKALQKALVGLKAVRQELKNADLVAQVDHDIQQHDQMASYYIEEAKNRLAVLGQPAAEWNCQDFAGKQHALKDYRGRVVVLDFWYRGCGWCIRAMPQMKEVAAHFADKPVTVFGMNTDSKEADATFVIEKMGLNYGNLKAEGIPEKYKVRGFPTLLILDQEGLVRDIHVGYSAELKEKVVASIEKILAKQ
jgi:thiol-disulfide isomerase/thioredoxin